MDRENTHGWRSISEDKIQALDIKVSTGQDEHKRLPGMYVLHKFFRVILTSLRIPSLLGRRH